MDNPLEPNPDFMALLDANPEAGAYDASLHPSVKARISPVGVTSPEELAAQADLAARSAMMDVSGIYDDSDAWPNGPEEP